MKAPLAKTSRSLLASRAGRWMFATLVFLSLALLVLGRVDHPFIKKMRHAAGDAADPVLSVLSKPIDRLDAAIDWAASLTTLVSENARLREENEKLLEWQAAALALERENSRLRGLLNVPRLEAEPVVSPRVIGVAGGPFVKSVMVNAGRMHGVHDDYPVLDEVGLVGRIFEAGRNAARVLLITDLNSRVPVRIQRTGSPAIARGRNDATLDLVFLPPDALPEIGDAVVTSGDGGIFPPDVLVGHIVETENSEIHVQPVALLNRLEFVQIVRPVSAVFFSENGGEKNHLSEDERTQ